MKTTTAPTIIEDRLKGLCLKTGSHQAPGTKQNPDCEMCAMEAAAYIRGLPHTDWPETACPVLNGYVIGWNDRADDEMRQKLIALLPALGISRSTREVQIKRAYHFIDVHVRVIIPNVLAEMDEAEKEWATKFRALPKINDETSSLRSSELVSEFANFLETPSTSPAPTSFLKQNDLARALDLALDRALDLALDLARALALDLALDLARALDLALARARARARDLARALALALDLARALPPAKINQLIFQPSFEAIETALAITE